MKLYGLNNIVKCGSNIYYIDMVGERLHLRNEKSLTLFGVTLDDDEKDLIEDIELSDWFFNSLFQNKESEEIWVIDRLDDIVMDIPYYRIEKECEGLYIFTRGARDGRQMKLALDNVRCFQNLYNFFRDYENGDYLEEEIDSKIQKLFKLI